MAAFQQAWKHITGAPATDMSKKRYTFVNFTAAGDLTIDSATAAKSAVGVIQEPNGVGEPAQVMVQGISFVQLGGTVAAGDDVEVGADGKAVKASAGAVVGICVAGGDTGAIGSVLLK